MGHREAFPLCQFAEQHVVAIDASTGQSYLPSSLLLIDQLIVDELVPYNIKDFQGFSKNLENKLNLILNRIVWNRREY